MLRRSFSKREKALLIILALLLIGIGYYLFVWQPVEERIESADARTVEAEDALLVEQTRYAVLEQMRAELAEMDAQPDSAAEIPPYDNAKRVMRLLNGVLSASKSYSISFDNIAFQGDLAVRSMRMSFSCNSYADAKNIIRALYAGPYRCTIGTMTFTASSMQGTLAGSKTLVNFPPDMSMTPVSVSMMVTFYEYLETAESTEATTE